MADKLAKAARIARDEGVRSLLSKGLAATSRRIQPVGVNGGRVAHMLVGYDDALETDWSGPTNWVRGGREVSSYSVAWIMSPPGEASGGHQNLFRFIRFMEERGHEVTIYLYSGAPEPIDIDGVRTMVENSASYSKVSAAIRLYADAGVAPGTDAIFATGWETAYPAFRDTSVAERFYFVQDFEPYFYAMGSEYVLAENTYRFGFHGMTAGRWLSSKLDHEYGMKSDHFTFGADSAHYHRTNLERRKEIFFYARPVTVRRGFELGLMALEHFARQRPDYTINLAGWDVAEWAIPFEHVNHGSLPVTELNDLYNRCAAGLVLSLTNMSLLPLELLASGVIPVMNEGDNNRLVAENAFIEFAPPSPRALADKLIETVDRLDQQDHSSEAARSVEGIDWDSSGSKFVDDFERVMSG